MATDDAVALAALGRVRQAMTDAWSSRDGAGGGAAALGGGHRGMGEL